MDNNDFLAAIEKGKERLTDANRSKEDYWFSGSMAMLEACLVEVWNTAKKDTIPIEWIENRIKQLSDIVDGFDKASLSYFLSDVKLNTLKDMLEDWKRENG